MDFFNKQQNANCYNFFLTEKSASMVNVLDGPNTSNVQRRFETSH